LLFNKPRFEKNEKISPPAINISPDFGLRILHAKWDQWGVPPDGGWNV
jgi:hypothetical protein